MRTTSANTATVAMTKATSAIVSSWMRFEYGSDQYRKPAARPDSAFLNGPHTPTAAALTNLIRTAGLSPARAAPRPARLGHRQRHAVVHEQREVVAELGATEGPLRLADHYRLEAAPGPDELVESAVAAGHP
jgi:hypothetical protein